MNPNNGTDREIQKMNPNNLTDRKNQKMNPNNGTDRENQKMNPNNLTDRERLQTVLGNLRNNGYFAKGPFWDCSTCAGADIPEEKSDRYVFWHLQDDDLAFGYRDIQTNQAWDIDDEDDAYDEDAGPIVYGDQADSVPESTQRAYPNLVKNLYLKWAGDATLIIDFCRQAHFETEWNGSTDSCIIILAPKRG